MAATGVALLLFRSTAIVPLLILAFLLRGGLFSTWATMAGVLGDRSPRLLRSRAFALLEMTGGVAFSLGPIVAGILYATNPTFPFEIAAAASFLLIPVFALAQRKMTAVPRDPDSGSRPVAVLPLPVERSAAGITGNGNTSNRARAERRRPDRQRRKGGRRRISVGRATVSPSAN